jgi:hypothetical protein
MQQGVFFVTIYSLAQQLAWSAASTHLSIQTFYP